MIEMDLSVSQCAQAQIAGAPISRNDGAPADGSGLALQLAGAPESPGAIPTFTLATQDRPALLGCQALPVFAASLALALWITPVCCLSIDTPLRPESLQVLLVVFTVAFALSFHILGAVLCAAFRTTRATLSLPATVLPTWRQREGVQRLRLSARWAPLEAARWVELHAGFIWLPPLGSLLKEQCALPAIVTRSASSSPPCTLVAGLWERFNREGLTALFARLHGSNYSRYIARRMQVRYA